MTVDDKVSNPPCKPYYEFDLGIHNEYYNTEYGPPAIANNRFVPTYSQIIFMRWDEKEQRYRSVGFISVSEAELSYKEDGSLVVLCHSLEINYKCRKLIEVSTPYDLEIALRPVDSRENSPYTLKDLYPPLTSR